LILKLSILVESFSVLVVDLVMGDCPNLHLSFRLVKEFEAFEQIWFCLLDSCSLRSQSSCGWFS